jgi:protein-S-isoprenylcysteine O-methyltransferase
VRVHNDGRLEPQRGECGLCVSGAPACIELSRFAAFLLNNGRHYHLAHTFAILEYLLSSRFYPARLAYAKATLLPLGLVMVIAAQALRSTAMATAAASFTHLIATSKREDHVLVTWGVYAYMRHPSYVAFFYWALGTQLVLGNPMAFLAFALVTWKYFDGRIRGALLGT